MERNEYYTGNKAMASLETLEKTIDKLKVTLPFKKIIDRNLSILEKGRRGNHTFIATSNMRNVRSGPNKGKTRINGFLLIMISNKDHTLVQTAIVNKPEKFLPTLDRMAELLSIQEEINSHRYIN